MKADNIHHPPDFVKNHVTGIFFQNKVDYATWFGWRYEYIHGIQMLPLSPALLLSRTTEFCTQEWNNILSQLALPSTDPWTSILLTGTLALVDPAEAYARLMNIDDAFMDDGLTKVWALYWAATAASGTSPVTTTTTSLGNRALDHEHGGILHIFPGTHHDDNDNNHNNHNHNHDHNNDICRDIHEPTGHPASQPGFGEAHGSFQRSTYFHLHVGCGRLVHHAVESGSRGCGSMDRRRAGWHLPAFPHCGGVAGVLPKQL